MATPAPLRAAISDLSVLADRDLSALWRQVSTADEARAALMDVLPSLVETYGSASATLSADWYDEMRDMVEARGRFRAIPADLSKAGTDALAGWGVSPLYRAEPDWDSARVLIAGGVQRRIANASRLTIMESSTTDPGARGWERVGAGTCPFCAMLIGRGAVYTEATADFLSHDHCNCAAVPSFEGAPRLTSVPEMPRADEPVAADQPAVEPERASAGRLDAAQYEVMQPDQQWSEEKRNAILTELRRTEHGKVLADTLDKFQDGGSIARLRTNIDKYLAGEDLNPTSKARAEAVVDALRNAPTGVAPDTLFRGMSVKGSQKTVLGKYTAGDTLDLNLTSFSSDRKVATRFQSMTAKSGSTRVMVELVGDSKQAIPIQNLARDKRLFKEKEWVAGGRYEIIEVKKSPSGGVILRVRQTGTL